jgi:hypothetical protein
MRLGLLPALRGALIVLLVLGVSSTDARAQAPINSNVALQPSKGGLIVRQQFRYTQASFSSPMGELDIETLTSIRTLVYGLTERFTLILESPLVISRQINNTTTGVGAKDSGFGDLRLMSKLRLYRDDFGPTSTARFDLIGGIELPTGSRRFGNDSIDPIVGGVYSYIDDRHGFNADALWRFNTGSAETNADVLKYDLAYSYRLSPETYASENPTALFAGLELNGFSETNDDNELFLSPGLQYVTQRWIIEATVQIPIWQSLNNRAERDYIIGVGVRFQF